MSRAGWDIAMGLLNAICGFIWFVLAMIAMFQKNWTEGIFFAVLTVSTELYSLRIAVEEKS